MICDENEENNLSQQIVESGVKSRKISIFKEFLRHDKNIICLPRKCLRDGVKSLEFIGFLGWKCRIYTLFTPLEDRIGKAEIII